MTDKKHVAIVLSGGSGSRMNMDTPKQYIEVGGFPVLYYSLKVFEDNENISEIVLVTRTEDSDYCKTEIVGKYGFRKVTKIVSGGARRQDSVYNGLMACGGADYVHIHDGARPLIKREIIDRAVKTVEETDAAVCGMKSKDTVKVVDSDAFAMKTPDRDSIWIVQTPQSFSRNLIVKAYENMEKSGDTDVTDDASIVEKFTDTKVKMIEGSYENIKVTTKSDLWLVEALIGK